MTDKQKRVLRAPEAATYTGLSESTLAKRRLYGLPPAFLNLGGRAIGYAIDDLDVLPAPIHLTAVHKWRGCVVGREGMRQARLR
jgi:predicted DNA-binding transcriptional regulator AlpA